MNALTTVVPIEEELWYVVLTSIGSPVLSRTARVLDKEGPSFLGYSLQPEALARAERFAECVNTWVGVKDPVAELSRLRQIEARWNAITEAPARTVALLGDGVGSMLPEHADAASVAAAYRDVQRGPAPWIVVECWPKPSLFLAPSHNWAGKPEKAELHFRYDDALDLARVWGGEVVSLEWVLERVEVVATEEVESQGGKA